LVTLFGKVISTNRATGAVRPVAMMICQETL
jgi:hypothetical protein